MAGRRRNRSSVGGFADLIWRIYQDSPAVKHLITVLAIAVTVVATAWINHTLTISQIAASTQHLDNRFDTLSISPQPSNAPHFVKTPMKE